MAEQVAVSTASSSIPRQPQPQPQPEQPTADRPPGPPKQAYLDSLVVPSDAELTRIAEVQADRERKLRRRSRDERRRSSSAAVGPVTGPTHTTPPPTAKQKLVQRLGLSGGIEGLVRKRAAIVIQRHYRGYRTRREIKGLCLDADTRWVQALREMQYRLQSRPQLCLHDGAGGPSDADAAPPHEASNARKNWKRATTIALRAGLNQDSDSSDSSSDLDSDSDTSSTSSAHPSAASKARTPEEKAARRLKRAEAKARRQRESLTMGLQYFLEMVDPRHRYGANLRLYHEEWKLANTHENFFFWLDHGAGRLVDMAACPREQLDREQVRYLSREERQYYLVRVDRTGRLCWAKNGAHIDTAEGFRNSIHGIVPADDPTPTYEAMPVLGPPSPPPLLLPLDAGVAQLALEAQPDTAVPPDTTIAAAAGHKVHHVSATAVLDALMRKSVQKNTWIFVADTNFRLYVGIKDSGTFQHSSFLQGSRIAAAGLIRIRDGQLASISPLSGHYRPPAANFRAFVQSLKEAGVDMSHVTFSKSYAVLVGMEAYVKTRQRGKDLLRKLQRHGHIEQGEEGDGAGKRSEE